MPQLGLSMGMPFIEAAKIMRGKLPMAPADYYGKIADEARIAAFTASNLASLEQIKAVMESLAIALKEGKSLDVWKAEALATNWNLPNTRLDTIFRTNVQTAYMTGHWRQFQQHKDTRPFLMYSAIDDTRVRPSHLEMSGYIALVDDAIWNQWTPPAGFNCRCTLISLTEAQAKARGYGKQQTPNVFPDKGFGHHPSKSKKALNEILNDALAGQPNPIIREVVKQEAERAPEYTKEAVQNTLRKMGNSNYDWYTDYLKRIEMSGRTKGYLTKYPEEQVVSLYAYTSSAYESINKGLRGSQKHLDNWRPVIAAADRLLQQLETHEGATFRGVYTNEIDNLFGFMKAHQVGNVVEYRGFTSTSYDLERSFSGDIRFIIESKNGRKVEGISASASELEVLFRPSSKFRVTRIKENADPKEIYLTELPFETKVPAEHIFAVTMKRPEKADKETLRARIASELDTDEASVRAFMATHNGMTPLEYIASIDPAYAEILDARKRDE